MKSPFHLHTVRSKLTTLVAFSVTASAVALPIFWWSLERQLIATSSAQVSDAQITLRREMAADLQALLLAAHTEASIWEARGTAEAAPPPDEPHAVGELLVAGLDAQLLRVVADDGRELASYRHAPRAASSEAEGDGAPAPLPPLDPAHETGIDWHGCGGVAGATLRAVVPFTGGRVEACSTLTAERLAAEAKRLHLELALPDPAHAGHFAAHTTDFPAAASQVTRDDVQILSLAGRTWCAAPVEIFAVDGRGSLVVVVASDLSDTLASLRYTLLVGLLAILLTSVVALLFGARLASKMSRALKRVSDGFRRINEHEYVHVDLVKTGDELEDLAIGFNAMVDGLLERDHLRATFGKYMTPEIVDHLMAGKVELGGESLQVTVLFTDIRDFTSLSEKMEAHALVALLNEYFTEMVAIVIGEGGVVDKYIGDAIMAVFGAPVPHPDDALRAARAALRMRTGLASLNERLAARGVAPLRTGIGIHSGTVVAGNIGSEQRMEYTVIGDSVNLASRLEGSTKELGVDVVISDETLQQIKGRVRTQRLSEIHVKGRAQGVVVHELLGLAD